MKYNICLNIGILGNYQFYQLILYFLNFVKIVR